MNPDAALPVWATGNSIFSITKTNEELSIVCAEENIPASVKAEKNWRAFKVEGPIDFALTGILSSIISPLAEADISIFAISTYDTDYVLVKNENVERTISILKKFCHVNP